MNFKTSVGVIDSSTIVAQQSLDEKSINVAQQYFRKCIALLLLLCLILYQLPVLILPPRRVNEVGPGGLTALVVWS